MMMPSSMCAFLELLATWLTRDAHGQRVPGLWERVPYADVQIVKKVVSARNKIALYWFLHWLHVCMISLCVCRVGACGQAVNR